MVLSMLTALILSFSLIDWILLCSTIFLGLYIVGTWPYTHFRSRGIYFSNPRWPFLGDSGLAFLGLRSLQETMLEGYAKSAGLGVFGVFKFLTPMILLRDPDVIKAATVKQFDHFVNHQDVVDESADPMFQKNLFMLKDQQWREMRKTLSPAFTTSKIKGMFSLIQKCSQQMTEHLFRVYQSSPEGGKEEPMEVDMKDLFSRMATDIIGSAAFGVRCDSFKEPKNRFYRMGKALTTFRIGRILALAGWVVVPWFMKILKVRFLDPDAISFFTSVVTNTIAEREEKNIRRPDMLQLLMQARDGDIATAAEDEHENEKIDAAKRQLTEEDIVAQGVIFFFAGFETVSTALCFASLAISQHPEVQRKLNEEIDEVMENTGGNPTYDAIQSMKYLDMVIHETLRLYPPIVATDRQCVSDAELATNEGPMHIRKGDILLVLGLHLDPEYWPQPLDFIPERFSEENKHKIRPFTYMPFGNGPRLCIGQRFALIEMKLALFNLLSKYDLQPSSKVVMPIKYLSGLNVAIKGGFWCKLKPKNT